MSEFRSYNKIHRLHPDTNNPAQSGRELVVSEKIDGSNAQVMISEVTTLGPEVAVNVSGGLFVAAGSRKRFITPEDDNFGFAAWVRDHAEELVKLGPGTHYGEWWGGQVNRKYGLARDDMRFSLFNYKRWAPGFGRQNERFELPRCVSVVPVLYAFDQFDTAFIEQSFNALREQGSEAVPGYDNPEGVVAEHMRSGLLLKVTDK